MTNQLPPPIMGGRAGRESLPKSDVAPVVEPTEKDLTIKQRKWLEKYIELGNATEAAMQVYDCKDRDSANAIGSQNLSKLSFIDLLERMGVTDKMLVDKINEGLSAQKQIGAMILIDRNGNVIKSENEGMIETADHAVRHKYLESLLKVKGKFKTADVQVQQNFKTTYEEWMRPEPIIDLDAVSPSNNKITFVSFKDKTDEELHDDIQNIQQELEARKAAPQEAEVVEQVEVSEPLESDKSDTIKEEEEIAQIAHPKKEDVRQEMDKRKQASLHTSPVAYSQPVQQQSTPDTFRIGE